MDNQTLLLRKNLKRKHYVRKADPKQEYWFDFSASKLEKYKYRTHNEFNLIIAGSEDKNNDFYIIPYPAVVHMCVEFSLQTGIKKNRWWMGYFKVSKASHLLMVRNAGEMDITQYHGDRDVLNRIITTPTNHIQE